MIPWKDEKTYRINGKAQLECLSRDLIIDEGVSGDLQPFVEELCMIEIVGKSFRFFENGYVTGFHKHTNSWEIVVRAKNGEIYSYQGAIAQPPLLKVWRFNGSLDTLQVVHESNGGSIYMQVGNIMLREVFANMDPEQFKDPKIFEILRNFKGVTVESKDTL